MFTTTLSPARLAASAKYAVAGRRPITYFPATPKPIISADVRSVRNSRDTPRHVKVFGFLYGVETTAIGRSQPMIALRRYC
jgi:hypothetical protein